MVDSFKSQGFSLGSTAPDVTEPDAKAVLAWVRQELAALVPRLNNPGDLRLTVLHEEPGKPREGQLVWADGTDWNPGQGAGFYGYTGAAWTDLLSGLDVSTFMRTVLDDTSATAALATLGIAPASYTPTLFNTTNVAASTAFTNIYIPISDRVLQFGYANVDPTAGAGTATELGISLNVPSNFSSTLHCLGVMASGSVLESGEITADVTNDRAVLSFLAQTTANHGIAYAFMYRVI